MNQNMLKMIGAAILTGGMGTVSMASLAGDGVVVVMREVPPRPAYRAGEPGHAVAADVSPDDQVVRAVGGQRANLLPTELSDGDFVSVSTGNPHGLGVLTGSNKTALSDVQLGSNGLNGVGNASAAVQSMAPGLTGQVGHAVGAATGAVGVGVSGATGALGGLTGAIMRSSGP